MAESHSAATTVVLARFEDLIGRGLRALIEDEESLRLVAHDVEVSTLSALLDRVSPRVALVDADALSGPEQLRELRGSHPDVCLIVLADRPAPRRSNELLAAGATACLPKQTEARDVLNAIHLGSRGLHVLPGAGNGHGHPLRGVHLLTRRETGVLELLREGRSNAEIALALHVSVETVRTHARHIYRKLGVRTRRELLDKPPLAAV